MLRHAVLILGMAATVTCTQAAESPEYQAAMQSVLGLDPSQIERFKAELDRRQKAIAERPNGPVEGLAESREVFFEPGRSGEHMILATGRVSVITFVDATGAPWPIEKVSVGNADYFDVAIPRDGGNSVTISPLREYRDGNIVVFLANEPEPISISVETSSTTFHERLNFSVRGRGPSAMPQTPEASVETLGTSSVLYRILDKDIPNDARRVRLEGAPAGSMAWVINNNLFLRTRGELVNPPAVSIARGTAGFNAFEMKPYPSVIVSEGGRLRDVEVVLNERDDRR